MLLVLLRQGALNAFADGENVYFTVGILRFIDIDDKPALILGHKMAHNTREHIETQLANISL